jgi:hypothetical protein
MRVLAFGANGEIEKEGGPRLDEKGSSRCNEPKRSGAERKAAQIVMG